MVRRAAMLLVLLGAGSTAAWSQVKAGEEFQVNTYTPGAQWPPVVAVEQDGDFTVVWVGLDGDLEGVFGQRFEAAGGRRGGEFQVNTYTTSTQGGLAAAVSADRHGDLVVIWPSRHQDGDETGVFGQRYAAAGARTGDEFQVNAYTTGGQGTDLPGSVAVAHAPPGGFVVVWNSWEQDGSEQGIFMRRHDAGGVPLGGDVRVNTYTTGMQALPSVAMDAGGNFVVVWESRYQDRSGAGVFGQRFDASGAAQGGEFRVNTYTTGAQANPAVARAHDGPFVVVWFEGVRNGSSADIFGQRFDAQGNRIGSDFAVNTVTTGFQTGPSVALDGSGNFNVAWSSLSSSGERIAGRRFAKDGSPRGGEFQASGAAADLPMFADVGSDEVGNFVVTWGSYQNGSSYDVFAQRFGGLRPTALNVDTGGNTVIEPGEAAVDVRPTWHNFNGASQTFGGALGNLTGPAGATYTIDTAAATYGTVADGASAQCTSCYAITVSATRPVLHWDATAEERITPDTQGQAKRWTFHVGDSFADVSDTSPFYRSVETLLHHGITSGCGGGNYCPTDSTSRGQMAVFVLAAKEGAAFAPPACTTPVFNDVPASSPFCRWIEELARRGVVTGCGGGNYCPNDPVTREQMAVFVLRTLDPVFTPPACGTPAFNDVPAASPFCRWIEELARRGVVTGCGGGNYCPHDPVTREQMGVFISVTFGLALYAP